MEIMKLISSQVSYNTWANERLINWLLLQDVKKLDEVTPSSFETIHFTIQHMLRTQRFWLAFVQNEDVSNFNWKVRKEKAEIILKEFLDQSYEMENKIKIFSEEDLLTELNLDMPWAKNKMPRYTYVLHVVNHSTFHRGQIVTMSRSLGLNQGIPATDFNIFNCP